MDAKTLGAIIKVQRLRLNLSQKQAGNLFTPSIDQSAWSAYERGASCVPDRVVSWLNLAWIDEGAGTDKKALSC